MCTLIVLYRPGHPWPVLLAGNRDEMRDRPWRAPARHWPDRPGVIAGIDALAGGSWFGVNNYHVAAAVMNRHDTLGPEPGKRSRGELVLEALDHADAKAATDALLDLDPAAYRPFNLVVADGNDVYWLRLAHVSKGIEAMLLEPGISMITAYDSNDESSLRVKRYLPQWRNATAPEPDEEDWSVWERLLSDVDSDAGPEGAMNVVTDAGVGTVSSQLLALPALNRFGEKPRFRFAAGRPDTTLFKDVPL